MVEDRIQVGAGHMPTIGLGLWKLPEQSVASTVVDAVAAGYRHLDSAADYGNESAVGEGLRQALKTSNVTRDDLWVTSKLWNTFHRPEHVRAACERSLKDLGLDCLDLYLIHFPIALKYVDFSERYPPEWIHDPEAEKPRMEPDLVPIAETWGAMEGLVEAGLVKEIGVCNFNTGLLHDLIASARRKPALLQIESHPYLTQERLIRLAQQYEMAVTAFSPLGSLSYLELGMAEAQECLLDEPVICAAANRLQRSSAQILLRWGLQRGTAVIPKSSQLKRLRENIDVFDFSLSDAEMSAISALNRNRRFNDPGLFCDEAFGSFFPIYD
ncbi:aldo/keto reductase [Luminiphilus sp. nBUS_16]|uniref:aldo/keto reductase n=1 Tax=unclassified Luminiphilus TaxID=2633198 RepID=UPI003EBD66A2